MKILVIVSESISGSHWHRLWLPHQVMVRMFADVEVTFSTSIDKLPDEDLRRYDIAVTHLTYWGDRSIDRVKRLGVLSVIDYDDFWYLSKHFTLADKYHSFGLGEFTETIIPKADTCTCTTPILRKRLLNFNPSVHVLPNGVDPKDPAWKPAKKTWPEVRFGYTGALEHDHDLSMISGAQNAFDVYLPEYYRSPRYAGYKYFAPVRVHRGYATVYNNFDVSIVPLWDDVFNAHKSELKMIEAGWKRKPIIVSNVYPYKTIATKENCLAVDGTRPADWIKVMRKMRDSEALREDLAEGLWQTVKDKYNLENVTRERYQIYKHLCDGRR